MYEFKFPDVGEGIQEGEIVRWRVKVGDKVKEDQPLVEMETAKAIVELPSPKTGTVVELRGKEGDAVNVGAVLVVIDEGGPKTQSASAPSVIGKIPTSAEGVVLPARKPSPQIPVKPVNPPAGSLLMYATAPHPHIDYEHWGPVERIPLHGVRRSIAEHMVKSKFTIPHVTHFDEMDAAEFIKLREGKKPEAEKQGVKLTYLPFIIKAAAEILKKHPALNAAFNDETGREIIYKKYYNIGVAVDTPEGLMVPVIKNADQKNVFQIAKELAELSQKCRDRTIDIHDLQGGTFSITNIGSVGGLFATPIITYGQTGNLGVYRIKEKPVVRDGKIEIRPILTLSLSYDHRVVDGAEGARFMNDMIAGLHV